MCCCETSLLSRLCLGDEVDCTKETLTVSDQTQIRELNLEKATLTLKPQFVSIHIIYERIKTILPII